jgi:hypothetical protein
MATTDLSSLTEETEDTSVVPTGASETALVVTQGAVPGVSGAVGKEDIVVPRLNVVQKMSDKFIDLGFNAGDVVYAQEVLFANASKVGNLTVVGVFVQYQQVLPYGGDVLPKVVNTIEEVIANGGSTTIGAPNEYSKIATITGLIEAPDDISDAHESFFPLEFEGKLYSMAKWTVAKTAFRDVAKPLLTQAMMFARNGGIFSIKYQLSTKKSTNGTNSWYSPVLKQVGRHTPEFTQFAAQFAGQ